MNAPRPTVFIVDDDPAVLTGMELLMRSVELQYETHASAASFLEQYDSSRPGCLVLDIRMPEMSGVQLQKLLRTRQIEIPIVFLTAHGDVHTAVEALKEDAFDFLQKPCNEQQLLDRVQQAIRQDEARRKRKAERKEAQKRLRLLSTKEHEVLRLVVEGKISKAIALDLGISVKTVDFHRANILKKLEVTTMVELLRLLHTAEYPGLMAGE